ncbi:hypothetical protein T8A63_19710 (plasmid) [Sulfitobacter sp. OXR-159]|uniref:hypothetical protein n=1 Tax=Sulfitobacter sp. OXR-159 TaxID=3100174 RepID=UPI002AC9B2AC|nr:hypothetical protein [Sulfitobacter sp. OXR-159]WPZ31558.1 hypothetical protein T8A63_19710 [Sulfitobacter sp. OXR-159]
MDGVAGEDGSQNLGVQDSHFANAKRTLQAVFTARYATGAAYCVLVKPGIKPRRPSPAMVMKANRLLL